MVKKGKDIGKGFDRLAGVYDALAQLVFGRAIRKAQCALLDQLPKEAHILLIGGGTGWLLKPLFDIAKPAHVTYIDASQAMIERARAFAQRVLPHSLSKIHFIHGTQAAIPKYVHAQVIITPFFLDLFTESELPSVLEQLAISQSVNQQSYWYLIDFQYPKNSFRPIASVLIWLMYRFFRLFTGMSGNRLLAFSPFLQTMHYHLQDEKMYFSGMIISQMWTKSHDRMD